MADAVPTAGLEFRITGDASGFRAALMEAQQAQMSAAKRMAEQFAVATGAAKEAIDQFVDRAKEALSAAGTAVAAGAGAISGAMASEVKQSEKTIAGAFDSMKGTVDGFVNSVVSKAGPFGRAFGVAWNAGLKHAFNAGLDAVAPEIAKRLDNVLGSKAFENLGQSVATGFKALLGSAASGAHSAAGILGFDAASLAQSETAIGQWAGAIRKKVDELVAGVRTALQKLAGTFTGVTDEVKAALKSLDKQLTRQEFQTGLLGLDTGEAAARRTQFEFLAGLDKTIDKLTETERRELTVRQERARIAATEEENRRREIADARMHGDVIRSVVASLERQTAMERAQAEGISQTAGQRARARALAMAEGFRSGRGGSVIDNPEVQTAVDQSAAGADAAARLRHTNEMTLAVHNQTDAYMLQVNSLGATAGQTAKLQFELQQLQAAQRAGVPITDELRASIERNGDSIGRMAAEVARAQERFRVFQDIGRTVASSLEQAFDGFMSGTKMRFSDFVKSLQADLAKLAFREGLMGLFGGGKTGGGGLIGTLLAGFGGFMADGGPVSSGTPYVVGERGPELFVPRSAGTIMPNGATGGGPSQINMKIDLAGANGDETIARISRQAASIAAQQAIEASNAAFPARQRRLQLLGA